MRYSKISLLIPLTTKHHACHLFAAFANLLRPTAVQHFVACEGVVTYKQRSLHVLKFVEIWATEVEQHGQGLRPDAVHSSC